ncbi:MAG: glycosyltransferase [Candidatus Coatesbacteria bacterium]|nr:glycosyltransferase [Candidatus Coatesbacteria bacterium]
MARFLRNRTPIIPAPLVAQETCQSLPGHEPRAEKGPFDLLILHHVHDLPLSGPQRGTADLCAGLRGLGWPTAAASLTGDGPARAYFESRGVPVHLVGGTGDSQFSLGWKLARLSRRIGATALHGHPDRIPSWIAGALTGRPVFVTFHRYGFDGPAIRLLTRLAAPLTAGFGAVSRRVRRYVVESVGVDARRVVHIPNGMDVDLFRPELFDRANCRAELGLSGDVPTLCYVGRLAPRKGLAIAIKALAGIDGLRLLLVGDGDYRTDLERLARCLGLGERLRFTGRLADPRPVYAACDAAVAIGRGESFNRGLVEPLLMGIPAVGLAQGGVPDVVPPDCWELLLPEYCVEALTAKLRDLLSRSAHYRAIAQRAAGHIRREFTMEAMIAAHDRLYRRVLLEGRPPAEEPVGWRPPRFPDAVDPDVTPELLPVEVIDEDGRTGDEQLD